MSSRAFRHGFAQLAPLGLSFDAWLYHPQILELADLASAFPDVTIVLDHYGGPIGRRAYADQPAAAFQNWGSAISDLARHANVNVKLGGLGMWINGFGFHDQATQPSSVQLAQAWRPYFETCLNAFGPKRCMFESNFPVDKGSFGYATFWNACKRMSAGLTPDEQASLFRRTANRMYRLGLDNTDGASPR